MTDNCERADHLAAEAARLMGSDNKYSRELRRLKNEFEDLNKGLTAPDSAGGLKSPCQF